MYTLIAGVVSGLVIFLIITLFYYEYTITDFIVMGIAGIFIGAAIGFFFGAIYSTAPQNLTTYVKTVNIVNIQDGKSVDANFFLGIGTINSKLKYTYYYKIGNQYKLNQVGIKNAYIEYTDSVPRLDIYYHKCNSNWAITLNKPIPYRYIFYIPKKSIKTDYNLDAK